MVKTLIIGAGEIGKSLGNVLATVYEVQIVDRGQKAEGIFDVINICYPYQDKFVEITKEYIGQYKPKLIIIHSTVPVGTTRQIPNAVHSPVNGRHPHLEQGIRTFIKFIGATNGTESFAAEEFLHAAGIKTYLTASPETTELAKILCTTRYGWMLTEMKETERLCREYNVPFQDVYTNWNKMYNQGYHELNEERFFRPIYMPMKGGIGGHCVINNCALLRSFTTDIVKGRNELYKKGDQNDKHNNESMVPKIKQHTRRSRSRRKDDTALPRVDRGQS